MTLSNGVVVWVVVASERDIRGQYEATLAELRRQASVGVPNDTEMRAWGSVNETGAPALIDLSSLVLEQP